jgi:hypothetical protein
MLFHFFKWRVEQVALADNEQERNNPESGKPGMADNADYINNPDMATSKDGR